MVKSGEDVPMKDEVGCDFLMHFSCTEPMLVLLNSASDTPKKILEEAIDPFSAGVLSEMDGICGVYWAAAVAAGIRSSISNNESPVAAVKTLTAVQAVMSLNKHSEKSIRCGDLTGLDRWNLSAFIAGGNVKKCHDRLARSAMPFHWVIDQNLAEFQNVDTPCMNCAVMAYSRVVDILEIQTETDPVVAAGFAGGLGLSGNVCGALAATLLASGVKYFENRNSKQGMIGAGLQGVYMGDRWVKPLLYIFREFYRRLGFKHCREKTGRIFQSPLALSTYLDEDNCQDVFSCLESLLIE